MKKILIAMASVFLLLGISGCGPSSSTASSNVDASASQSPTTNTEISTPDPTATSSSYEGNNGTLSLTVDATSVWFGGFGYTIFINFKNLTNSIQHMTGNLYAGTSDGSVYGRPSDAVIGLYGSPMCDAGPENYIDSYWNPNQEAHWTYCFAVPQGQTITRIFVADAPDQAAKLETQTNIATN